MTIEHLKEHLQELIAHDEIPQTIQQLKVALQPTAQKAKSFILLRRQWQRVRLQMTNGVLTREEANVALNRFTEDLLAFIDLLTATDLLANASTTRPGITNTILLITRRAEQAALKRLFKVLGFTAVEVTTAEQYATFSEHTYDVIIFDNRDIPFCNDAKRLPAGQENRIHDRIRFMNQLLANRATTYFIHYGEIFYWVRDHRERVQAANSKFSLYARTKEVVDFINYS